MIWRRRLGWRAAVGFLVLIGSSEPGGFGFTVGYTVAFVGVPAWVLTWALRTRDRDLWRRALLLFVVLWVGNYLPPLLV